MRSARWRITRALVLAAIAIGPAACGSKKQANGEAAGSASPGASGSPAAGSGTSSGSDASLGSGAAAGRGASAGSTAKATPTARVEHAVFSLVDNRHAAHRLVDGELVIDAADIGFARYTRFGVPVLHWHLGKDVDGERAAIADRRASIDVPLTAEQAAAVQHLTARVHAGAKQSLALRVNGRPASAASAVPLVAGWQTIAIPIGTDHVWPGENELAFELRGSGATPLAIAWLHLGAAPTPTPTPTPTPDVPPPPASPAPTLELPDPRAAASFDPKTGSIRLARNAGLVWYVTLPDGANLVAEVAGDCRVEVRATAGDAKFAGGLLGGGTDRVDLTALENRVVALSLTARECAQATLVEPRITIHGAEPVLAPPGAPPRYIVLWVMDALRADRIPTFTPGARAQTPTFDELAKSSAVFRQYYEQGNESQTSHTSIWTSLYPAVHNVRTTGVGGTYKIAQRFPVLAELVKAAGFTTTAVTGNGFVTSDGGYTRGFDSFRNMMREQGIINGIIYARTIVDDAIKRLDAARHDPTFLFLGTIDNHGPWIARKPWIDLYSPGKYTGPFQQFGTAQELGMHRGQMGCSIIPPPEDVERLRAIYDSAISYQDQELGRFVEQLKSWGVWDQTMLIITADHGEELFEDTRCGHGGSLRDSLLRVPLLVHDPARVPPSVIDEGAEGIDILPTVLDALGAPPLQTAQGASLIPLAQGIGRGWPRPSYASQYEYAHAMRIGRWKIRVNKTGVPLVEDMIEDPQEHTDLARTRPIERRMLTDNLSLFLALRTQWQKREWGVPTAVTPGGAAALDVASTP